MGVGSFDGASWRIGGLFFAKPWRVTAARRAAKAPSIKLGSSSLPAIAIMATLLDCTKPSIRHVMSERDG